MFTPKAAVTQAEICRYLKALRDAGYSDGRIEIDKPNGTKVSIITGETSEAAVADDFDAMIEKLP